MVSQPFKIMLLISGQVNLILGQTQVPWVLHWAFTSSKTWFALFVVEAGLKPTAIVNTTPHWITVASACVCMCMCVYVYMLECAYRGVHVCFYLRLHIWNYITLENPTICREKWAFTGSLSFSLFCDIFLISGPNIDFWWI